MAYATTGMRLTLTNQCPWCRSLFTTWKMCEHTLEYENNEESVRCFAALLFHLLKLYQRSSAPS
eukprot:3664923-Heterocapsa_arctica.AAC.1